MCHCTQCRRMTGHIMAATAARRADFSLVSDGELKWYVSSVEARRGFCGRCGSTLFWEGVGLDGISIAAGTLDDTRGLKIACHIFVADKGDYYEIESGAPQIRDGRFSVPFPDS
ncbi:MAG: GFA family protein [Gammaproteobacteria bacterium]|nr:MAG: GFA family protein [Gammaproteobacteria bacterium]TLZ11372.1 MAG: GFA family protein [Gammaproteobacteria bacterium]TLZ11827.1 MAG: GFA family protein [Gammaproteobacteria bacterium]TLZ19790.1 MAG: GFA family protein [Gammaproteobacteria bacterium]TLZ25151.1 MAG: GFA family protein [Gammaproteobacteria bacterium]